MKKKKRQESGDEAEPSPPVPAGPTLAELKQSLADAWYELDEANLCMHRVGKDPTLDELKNISRVESKIMRIGRAIERAGGSKWPKDSETGGDMSPTQVRNMRSMALWLGWGVGPVLLLVAIILIAQQC